MYVSVYVLYTYSTTIEFGAVVGGQVVEFDEFAKRSNTLDIGSPIHSHRLAEVDLRETASAMTKGE